MTLRTAILTVLSGALAFAAVSCKKAEDDPAQPDPETLRAGFSSPAPAPHPADLREAFRKDVSSFKAIMAGNPGSHIGDIRNLIEGIANRERISYGEALAKMLEGVSEGASKSEIHNRSNCLFFTLMDHPDLTISTLHVLPAGPARAQVMDLAANEFGRKKQPEMLAKFYQTMSEGPDRSDMGGRLVVDQYFYNGSQASFRAFDSLVSDEDRIAAIDQLTGLFVGRRLDGPSPVPQADTDRLIELSKALDHDVSRELNAGPPPITPVDPPVAPGY